MKKLLLLSMAATAMFSLHANAQTYWKASSGIGDIINTYNFSVTEPKTIQQSSVFSPLTADAAGFIPTQTFCKNLITTSTTAAENLNASPSGFILSGGTHPKLTMIGNSGTGNSPATSRFASYDFINATNIGSFHFKLNLGVEANNTDANWYFMIGAGTSNPGVITSTNANPTTASETVYTHDNRIFGEYRLMKDSTNGPFVHTTMDVESATSGTNANRTWTPNTNANLNANQEYKIDIFCNNSISTQKYIMNSLEHDLAKGTYAIYVDNVLKATLSKLTVTTNTGPIRSFTIFCREPSKSDNGSGGTEFDNSSSLTISDFKIVHLGTVSTTPVTLTDFNGKVTNNSIALNWQTASESKNSHFILNRSANGADFSYLARIEGNGTTSNVNTYNYEDNNPVSGTNYYQLEQVDLDGAKTIIEKIVDVKYDVFGGVFTVSLESANQLKAVISSEKNEIAELLITDIGGKVIYKSNKALKQGNNQLSLFIPSVKPGVYVATVKGDTGLRSVKFVL